MLRYCGGSACWSTSSSERWIGWPLIVATIGSLNTAGGEGGAGAGRAGFGMVPGFNGGVADAGGLWAIAGPKLAAAAQHSTTTRRRRKQRLMRYSGNRIGQRRWGDALVYTGGLASSKHWPWDDRAMTPN